MPERTPWYRSRFHCTPVGAPHFLRYWLRQLAGIGQLGGNGLALVLPRTGIHCGANACVPQCSQLQSASRDVLEHRRKPPRNSLLRNVSSSSLVDHFLVSRIVKAPWVNKRG